MNVFWNEGRRINGRETDKGHNGQKIVKSHDHKCVLEVTGQIEEEDMK